MAYIRKQEARLVLAHRERASDGRSRQRTLFEICSKAEARAILGDDDAAIAKSFELRLERQFPRIRFDWDRIRGDIRTGLDELPDLFGYESERLTDPLREGIGSFARALLQTDPFTDPSAASVLEAHRAELEVLVELIGAQLEQCNHARDDGWGRTDPFFWRYALPGAGVPLDVEEQITAYYDVGDDRLAAAGFGLLVRSFDRYAEGYNYLGIIARNEGRLEEAAAYFEKTVEVGRTLFPRRFPRDEYWLELDTRPYMRGLRNLALTLNELGRYEEALVLCERLERECGDGLTAAWQRAAIHLNLGRWQDALDDASRSGQMDSASGFIEALALEALSDRAAALAAFLHATLNHPRAARLLLGRRSRAAPVEHEEVTDHDVGVGLVRSLHGYLSAQPRKSKRFFTAILSDPRVEELCAESGDVARRSRENRGAGDRTAFDRLREMRSRPFAEAAAGRLADLA